MYKIIIKIKTSKFFKFNNPFGGMHRVLRIPTSILYIGAVLLFSQLFVGCVKIKRPSVCLVPNNPMLDCDGDGIRNNMDAFPNNACASVDTDGDGFPDNVETPTDGTPCDEEEAGELVTTLITKDMEDSDRVPPLIPGCSVAAFTMCEDSDDDGDDIKDSEDPFPTNACSSMDADGDGFPDVVLVPGSPDAPLTCTPEVAEELPEDAFIGNGCAGADTDGDGFPDSIKTPAAGTSCDEDEAEDLVTTLKGKDGADDVIGPGCAVAALMMCEDMDDDGDDITDREDRFPTNACASMDADGDGLPDAILMPGGAGVPPTCTSDVADDLTVDAFLMNGCAGIDTDGDGFPDSVKEIRAGTSCDEDEADKLVKTLMDISTFGDVIPGCSVATFMMCEDPDDDGDDTPDTMDDLPMDVTLNCMITPENIGSSSLDCDSDGESNMADNCPAITNPTQANNDTDTFGDACDVDDDNDGLIEINYLEDLDYVRYDLEGNSYRAGPGASPSIVGAPTSRTSNCGTEVNRAYLCGYELARDLDFNDNASYRNPSANKNRWTSGEGWNPMGPFESILDGNDNKIANLMIARSSLSIGLFSTFYTGGHIRNLIFENAKVSYNGNRTSSRVGILTGTSTGTIINIHARGGMASNDSNRSSTVGGLVGEIYCVSPRMVMGSSSSANIRGSNSLEDILGGLVGESCGMIMASHATGNVSTGINDYGGHVGGLVGDNFHEIIASYATGNVNGNNGRRDEVGGLVGFNRRTITASYATGNVSGGGNSSDAVGGLVGLNRGIITASYAMGNANGGTGDFDEVGGLVGQKWRL